MLKNDLIYKLSQPNNYTVIEKDSHFDMSVGNLFDYEVSDSSVASAGVVNNKLRVSGKKAGTVTVCVCSSYGAVASTNFQISDPALIREYVLLQGGALYFDGVGKEKACPVSVTPASALNSISWASADAAIASVTSNNLIRSVGEGATIVSGEFTDTWGVKRRISVLTVVSVPSGGSGLVEGEDGGYYKPVNCPPNVFEVVDEDGNSKKPPEYVYNPDGKPGNGNDRPAVPDGDGYWVEDPEGSNIWKNVGNDGNLIDSPALWGGPNGKPGGGDDETVHKFGADYWVPVGQNVWKKVDKNNPKGPLGPLTGGGPNKNPSAVNGKGRPIHTDRNGVYYIENGMDPDGNRLYYGDPWTPRSDKLLNSTTDGPEGDDVVYYKDANGDMTTQKPSKPVTGPDGGEGTDGRILDKNAAGDTADWLEIAKNGDYSLIVRSRYIDTVKGWTDTENQRIIFGLTDNNYVGSIVQAKINNWFDPLASAPQKLPADANLRNYTVKNTAVYALGSGTASSGEGRFDGLSKPVAEADRTGTNVAFALSYGEAANYMSDSVMWSGTLTEESKAPAKANFAKLAPYAAGFPINCFMWLRSPGYAENYASELMLSGGATGRAFQHMISESGLVYPALWVKSDIFEAV